MAGGRTRSFLKEALPPAPGEYNELEMGQEIFYCCHCQTQIRSADFTKGGALKLGDRTCCVRCGPTLLATLTPKEQEQFFREAAKFKATSLEPGTSRHALPAIPPPFRAMPPKPAITGGVPPSVWGGIAAVVLIVGLGVVWNTLRPGATPPGTVAREGPQPEAPTPGATLSVPVKPAASRKTPAELRQEEAQRKLDEIKEVDQSKRFAADEVRQQYAEFARAYADTAQGKTIASWLKDKEPKPEEPKVAEAPKPEVPKPDVPKPPEPPQPQPVVKPPEPALVEPTVKPPVPAPPRRPAVPDAAKQRDAEATLKKAFNLDQAKTPKDKAELARALLQTAATSGAKDAELFVLLRQARDFAAQGMDAKTALEAIDMRAAAFDVEALGEKVDLFAKTTAKGADAAAWAGAALDVAEEASEGDDYDAAVKLAARAEALARAANDKGLQETAKARSNELADLKRVADGLKGHFKTLETKPDDPAANAAVGRFVSLVKGDWKRGLPMLVKGSEPALKTLAEQELGNPTDASAQAALGEAWAAQADKETPTYKARARGRAAEWLGRAIPGLTGLARVSAERKLASLGPATGPKSRQSLDLGGGVRMELVTIKPGAFTMGSTEEPLEAWQVDESPEHKVTITKGYSLGKYEVTRGQFAAFVKATGYKTEAEKEGKAWGRTAGGQWQEIAGNNWQTPATFTQTDEHPVTCMSWNDAKAFCDWAAKKTARGARLPTEAEWEYACRAGTKTKWSFGDAESVLEEYAWSNKNSTHPVGQKKPNAWGLFDMYGNVWEWCQDWAGPYAAGDAVDPTGAAGGNARCLRGGCWYNSAIECRSTIRNGDPASNQKPLYGFRVAVP